MSTPTAETCLAIVDLITNFHYQTGPGYDEVGEWWEPGCVCGWKGDYHRAHVADAIRAHLAEQATGAAGAVETRTEWGVRRTKGDVGTVVGFMGDRRAAGICAREWGGVLVQREVHVGDWCAALAGDE